jgi:hypothetical protein
MPSRTRATGAGRDTAAPGPGAADRLAGVLFKPFDLDDLLAAVSSAVVAAGDPTAR